MKVANKKQPYNWNRVKPGDVISFRYKSKSTGKTLVQSILVLNPRLDVKLKDGKTTRHLTGIKIEESNKVSLRLNARQIALLEQIGDFKKIDDKALAINLASDYIRKVMSYADQNNPVTTSVVTPEPSALKSLDAIAAGLAGL